MRSFLRRKGEVMIELENPKPKPGQTQKDFIKECIPIVHKEHPKWSMAKVKAVCYNIWRSKHKEMEAQGYELFTDSAQFKTLQNVEVVSEEGETQRTGTKHMIAMVGDRFMNGGFFPAEEAKKCYKQWEGSLHDINHMGTSTGFFLAQTDITYFIGYHKNVKYDETTKEVSMEVFVHPKTHFAADWEAYIELCEMAGKIPNVSVTYYTKRKFIPASNLPKGINWKAAGYGKDDLVPVMYDVKPFCVSTVLQGRCGDKDGCGIRNGNSCECDTCKNHDKEIEEKKQELIKRIKSKEKKLKI